jgi:hypothetical protein
MNPNAEMPFPKIVTLPAKIRDFRNKDAVAWALHHEDKCHE